MESIEITGKTIDEATKTAATKLGVDAKSLKVTVLEEVKGLFGKSTVRIKAEVKAAKGKAAPAKAAKAAPVAPEPAPVEEAPAPVKAEKAPRGKKAKETSAVAAVEVPAEAETSDEPVEEVAAVEASQADQDQIEKMLTDMLSSANLDAQISSISRNGKYVNIEIDGQDVAHLVGKHGEVLNALQYLLNVVVAQQLKNGVRTTIDGQSYRKKREESLTKLATSIANEVSRRQEEAVLDALPAFERRIIHKVLAGMEGITTYSEGEEPNRRVVIAPVE